MCFRLWWLEQCFWSLWPVYNLSCSVWISLQPDGFTTHRCFQCTATRNLFHSAVLLLLQHSRGVIEGVSDHYRHFPTVVNQLGPDHTSYAIISAPRSWFVWPIHRSPCMSLLFAMPRLWLLLLIWSLCPWSSLTLFVAGQFNHMSVVGRSVWSGDLSVIQYQCVFRLAIHQPSQGAITVIDHYKHRLLRSSFPIAITCRHCRWFSCC